MGGAKPLRIPACQRLAQADPRLAARGIEGLHARPGHGAVHAQAYCFGKSLFGRESRRQEPDPALGIAPVAPLEHGNFTGAEHTMHEFFAITRMNAFDARYAGHIHTYAGNIFRSRQNSHCVRQIMSPGLPWRLYAPDIRLPDKPASYLDYAVRLSKTRRALPVTVRSLCPAPRTVRFAFTPICPFNACPSRPARPFLFSSPRLSCSRRPSATFSDRKSD